MNITHNPRNMIISMVKFDGVQARATHASGHKWDIGSIKDVEHSYLYVEIICIYIYICVYMYIYVYIDI